MELLNNFFYIMNFFVDNVNILIIFIISIILSIVFSINSLEFINFDICHLILLSGIIFLVIFLIFLCYLYFKTKNKLKTAEIYNKTLYDLNGELNSFKHDINNIHIAMSGYIENNNIEGLKKFYSDFNIDSKKINDLNLLSPSLINNNAIFSLLSTKYYEAVDKGITVNLYFFLDLSQVNIKIYELSRILGILFDNAIDAASTSKEKIINITFRRENNNLRDIVIIENSYQDKNINIDEIFLKGVSHKENHSGIGLWEVKKILSKHNNLNLYTSKTNDMFSQQLEIYFS